MENKLEKLKIELEIANNKVKFLEKEIKLVRGTQYLLQDQDIKIDTYKIPKSKELWVGFLLNKVLISEMFYDIDEPYDKQSKEGDLEEFTRRIKMHVDYLNNTLDKDEIKHFKDFDYNQEIIDSLKEGVYYV